MNFRTRSLAAMCAILALMISPEASARFEVATIDAATQSGEAKGQVPAGANAPVMAPDGLKYANRAPLGQGYDREAEPNETSGTATPIASANTVVRGSIYPNADVDFYSFSAAAGDKVYAAIMSSFSANGSSDSQLGLFESDGTTLIEFDDNDGTLGASSSTIAGATIPSAGTYFLRVNHFSASIQLSPYELHFRLQSGAPTPEVEGNNTVATANPLPANGWVSGSISPATDTDFYSFTAAAGDTVFLSLDIDPERDNVQWNGRLGLGTFGDASDLVLVVNDGTAGSAANPLSEAMFLTIKTAGTYVVYVDEAAGGGAATFTYGLSVSIHPAANEGVNCTTYTSTNVPQTIGPGAGLVSSTITVPGNPRIADIDVEIVLNHVIMNQIDASLRSPAGNDNGIFTDIGSSVLGGQIQMNTIFDDEAGIPPAFTVLNGLQFKPELAYRMSWFDGENAGGVWTLDLRDDVADANGGTLTSWSLRVCEAAPAPTCAPGFVPQTVMTTDFEAGAAGFTLGTVAQAGNEWALGTPATIATTTTSPVAGFTTCNSGVNCWKTDLTGTYNVSSAQDLFSPNIDLTGLSAPVVVTWAQKYQMESASFDHAFVDYQQVGGATPVRMFEWRDATMVNAPGNPAVNIGASSGWSVHSARADSLAGLNTELRFHLDSDSSLNFGGLAIDDVTVTACLAASADLSITKSDGVASAVPGSAVTYTITANNAGPNATAATVTDILPAGLEQCVWGCTGTSGTACTAGPVNGDINDAVTLPNGSSITYTLACTIAANATGDIVNTASILGAETDLTPEDNAGSDTTTVVPINIFADGFE